MKYLILMLLEARLKQALLCHYRQIIRDIKDVTFSVVFY